MKTLYLLLLNTPFKMKTLITLGLVLNKLGGSYKMFLILLTASATFPLLEAIKKYLNPNLDYWAITIIMLSIDTICGFYAHSGWWSKEAPNNLNASEFMSKVMRKIAACAAWIILIGVLENHSASLSMFTDAFSVSIIMTWLGWSITGSVHIFTGGKFPPRKIMKFFNEANKGKETKKNKNNE